MPRYCSTHKIFCFSVAVLVHLRSLLTFGADSRLLSRNIIGWCYGRLSWPNPRRQMFLIERRSIAWVPENQSLNYHHNWSEQRKIPLRANKYILLDVLLCSIAEYFDLSCAVFWRARRASYDAKKEWKYSAILHIKKIDKLFIIQLLYFTYLFTLFRREKRGRERSLACAANRLNRFLTLQNNQLCNIAGHLYFNAALFLLHFVQLDNNDS